MLVNAVVKMQWVVPHSLAQSDSRTTLRAASIGAAPVVCIKTPGNNKNVAELRRQAATVAWRSGSHTKRMGRL